MLGNDGSVNYAAARIRIATALLVASAIEIDSVPNPELLCPFAARYRSWLHSGRVENTVENDSGRKRFIDRLGISL
jgi:hypothetical protein